MMLSPDGESGNMLDGRPAPSRSAPANQSKGYIARDNPVPTPDDRGKLSDVKWRQEISFPREQRRKMMNSIIRYGPTPPMVIESDSRFIVYLPYWLEGHASLAVGIDHLAINTDVDPNVRPEA